MTYEPFMRYHVLITYKTRLKKQKYTSKHRYYKLQLNSDPSETKTLIRHKANACIS